MLTLVMSNNFLGMFVGWEGVGLASYLLIGFWFDKQDDIYGWYADCGKKAFIVNRIGDFGMLVAMFLIWTTLGTLVFTDVGAAAHALPVETATMICLLLLLGARRQKRADSTLHLVAGRHGWPNPCLRPHPCGDDGDGWRLHDRAHQRPLARHLAGRDGGGVRLAC